MKCRLHRFFIFDNRRRIAKFSGFLGNIPHICPLIVVFVLGKRSLQELRVTKMVRAYLNSGFFFVYSKIEYKSKESSSL